MVHALSIPRVCPLEGTTPRSRRAAIRGQYCGFSTDQGERANWKDLAAICHLPYDPVDLKQKQKHYGMTDVLTCSCHSRLDVRLLEPHQPQNWPAVSKTTYLGLRGHQQRIHCHLDGRVFNRCRARIRLRLLTFHDHPHILDETVDDLEHLGCGSLSLVLGKSVEPLKDRLDVYLPFLNEFNCIALNKATPE